MRNIEDIDVSDNPQHVYDCFNKFISSGDKKVFEKMIARSEFVEKTKDIVGDIVECGVFKGTGIFTFLKLKRMYFPNSHKKVIGFDFFDSESLLETTSGIDKEYMSILFSSRDYSHDKNYERALKESIFSAGFGKNDFDLITGDISKTSKSYVDENPGFRISLLYMDLDIEKPTYDALNNFWDLVSLGGIVVFDEYGYGKWTESIAVDKFFKDKNIKLRSTGLVAPTAYVIKESK